MPITPGFERATAEDAAIYDRRMKFPVNAHRRRIRLHE